MIGNTFPHNRFLNYFLNYFIGNMAEALIKLLPVKVPKANFLLLLLGLAIMIYATYGHSESLLPVYQSALNNDPQFQAAQQKYKADRELKYQGRAALLPTLNGGINYSRRTNDVTSSDQLANFGGGEENSINYQLTLKQELFNLGVFYGYKQILANVNQVENAYRVEQQKIILRSVELYFEVLRAIEVTRSLLSEQESVLQQLQQAQQSYEVGLVTITDVYDAQTSRDLLNAKLLEAKGNVQLSVEKLNALTGERYQQIAELKQDKVLGGVKPNSVDEWLEVAKMNSQSLEGAKLKSKAAYYNYQVKKSGHFPTLGFSWIWNKSNSDVIRPGKEEVLSKVKGNVVSFNVAMPLFSGGKISSERRQAQYAHKQQLSVLEQHKREVEQNVRSLFLLVTTNYSQIKAYKQSLKSSQSALDSTKAGYESGTRNLVDVLVSQRNLYQVKQRYANSRYNYLVNSLKLKQISGVLRKEDVEFINKLLNKKQLVNIASFQFYHPKSFEG